MPANTIVIRVYPEPKRPGFFNSYLDDRRIAQSRTPFYTSARALLKLGHKPSSLLLMHHGKNPKPGMMGVIGQLAEHTVVESRREGPRVAKYREFPDAFKDDRTGPVTASTNLPNAA